jgi:1-phosphofructokinase family hexose kinase
MILTVTPNTALDRIEVLPSLQPGKVLRSTSLTLSAGGKGVNVARAIKNLGGEVYCTGLLGGHTGRQHAELVRQEGLPASWTWIEGETRVAIVILDERTGEMTVINEEGPAVSQSNWEQLMADVMALAQKAEAVCISGSLPQRLDVQVYTNLVAELKKMGRNVWVDASGPALKAAAQARPTVVKINGLEASDLLGWQEIEDISTAGQAARRLLQDGFSQVVLTLGKLGAVSASKNGTWYACPPELGVICPIGSGDAFLGCLVWATLQPIPESEAIRQAVAAGSANALSIGGGKFSRQEFESILAQVSVKKLA